MSQGDVDLTADAPVFREDASDYGEDWTEEVEPEAPADLSETDAPEESEHSLASKSGKTDDISDEYEWDEEPEGAAAIATFRHVPVDVSQLREGG